MQTDGNPSPSLLEVAQVFLTPGILTERPVVYRRARLCQTHFSRKLDHTRREKFDFPSVCYDDVIT